MYEVIINTLNMPSYGISNISIFLIILGMLIIFLTIIATSDAHSKSKLKAMLITIGMVMFIFGTGSICYNIYETNKKLESIYQNNIQYINIHKADIDNIKDFDYNVIKKAENNDDKYDRAQKIRNYVEYKLHEK